MLRVLIAEDSPTAQMLIKHVLESDPQIMVVGAARDGLEAVEKAQQLAPDLITMDLDMPRLNGLQAISEIMSLCPVPIVVVSSSWNCVETEIEMESLHAGALALARKPILSETPEGQIINWELIETVKTMADVKVVRQRRIGSRSQPVFVSCSESSAKRFSIVAIATSTGGPPALELIMRALPADFPVPILVVQHISVGFTQGLVSWLDAVSPMKVELAQPDIQPKPGTVYIAPDDRHLGLSPAGKLVVSHDHPIGGFRPAATFLFETVARCHGSQTLAVMLTGMGNDGVEGLRTVHRAGGTILAQNEETCVVYGMPRAAVEAGIVHRTVPLSEVPSCLLEMLGYPASGL